MELTALQLFIGQAGIFTPEHQRHLAPLLHMLQRSRRAFARIEQRPRNTTITRAGAQRYAATHQGLLQGADDHRRIENVGRTRGTRHSLTTGKVQRIDQHKARQPHVLHGSRSAAYVAGMTGIDQNHTNILQHACPADECKRAMNVTEGHSPMPCTTTCRLRRKS